jgi:tetratricopeptide (TPR) repeat protein
MESVDILLEAAMDATDQGDSEKAITLYEQILAQEEAWATPHYNLGLIYKYRCDWEKSFYHNTRAVELDSENKGAQWNLGIAATMLQQWKVARTCWNVFGADYEIIDEDTAGYIGEASIRLDPRGVAETVWARRICPARAEIHNIPFPESGHGFLDIVLNDGSPKGQRVSNGKEYPIYNEIQHLKRSAYRTFSIKCKAEAACDPDFRILRTHCGEAGIAMEDWTATPGENHDEHHIAFAARSQDDLESVLHHWTDETGIEYYDPIDYSI